jgi:hypothetical protein
MGEPANRGLNLETIRKLIGLMRKRQDSDHECHEYMNSTNRDRKAVTLIHAAPEAWPRGIGEMGDLRYHEGFPLTNSAEIDAGKTRGSRNQVFRKKPGF